MKNYGPVFRFALPQIDPFVTVCDPELAKKILEEESEKPALYKAGEGVTRGVSSIFTKRTYGEDHNKTRKCIAPSFSWTNIRTCIPMLHKKLDLLKKNSFRMRRIM
jgi:cytochrome P450